MTHRSVLPLFAFSLVSFGALSACVTVSAIPQHDSPFSCEGPPPRSSPESTRTVAARAWPSTAPGRLDVNLVQAPSKSPPQEARFGIVAEGIPLEALALAVAEKLGVGVVVDRDVTSLRISLSLASVSLDDLGDVLLPAYGVAMDLDSGVLWFRGEAKAPDDRLPVETRLIQIDSPLAPAQVAATYCREIASPAGTASVVGSLLVVTDHAAPLGHLDKLVAQLERRTR